MRYPVSTFDSLGAQQLPKEVEYYSSFEDTVKYETDYFNNLIQQNDRVFELTFEMIELNEALKSQEISTITATATQSSIAELIDELGSENLKFIEHLGLGKECLGGITA